MKMLKIIFINMLVTTIVVYVFSAVYLRHLTNERIDAELQRVQSAGSSSLHNSSGSIVSSFQSSSIAIIPDEMASVSSSAASVGDVIEKKPLSYPKFYSTNGGLENDSCFSAPEEYEIDWNKMAQDHFKDFDINNPDLKILQAKHMHYESSGMWFVYFKIPIPENLVNTQWVVVSFDGVVTTRPVYLKGIITYSHGGHGDVLDEPVIEQGEICLKETSEMWANKQESNIPSRFVLVHEEGVNLKPIEVTVSSKISVSLKANKQQYEFNEPSYAPLYNKRPFRLFGFEDGTSKIYTLIELLDHSCSHTYLIYDVINRKIISSSGGGCG